MDLTGLAIIIAAFLVYALMSGRLDGTSVTAPMVFVACGFIIGPGLLGFADVDRGHSYLHVVAELTLIVVLFSDAARIDLKRVRKDHNLPARMLIFGLPLTIAAGTGVALLVLPAFSLWEAALLAALLAPTDAALGQAVVSNPAVPARVRQAINIESGLNDGIALPAVLLFAALGSSGHGAAESSDWITFGVMQVTLGPFVGIAIGFFGSRLLDKAAERGWLAPAFQGIGILALAGLCYVVAEMVGGNGFIAAFLGGMTFGNTNRHDCPFLFEFMESEGQLLMLITFLVFGIALLPEGIAAFEPLHFLYAVLSLTAIRMVPVAMALAGSGIRTPTKIFLGWFGPRGLASILFVLLILEEAQIPHKQDILAVTAITVALSTFLHGVTAAPLSAAFGRAIARIGQCEETEPVTELPLRDGMTGSDSRQSRTEDMKRFLFTGHES